MLKTHVLALVALVLFASLARAQSMEEADAAYAAGELDRAVELYDAVLARGGMTRERTAHVHLRLGVLRSSIGGEPREHFRTALAIQPSAEMPPELGPDAQAIFQQLRSETRPMSIALAPVDPEIDAPLEVGVTIENAPAIVRLRVSAGPPGDRPWTSDVEGTPEHVTVPAAAWRSASMLHVEVVGLDARGNELAAGGADIRASAPALPVEPEPAPAQGGDDVIESPWLWIAIAVVVLGGAAAAIGGVLATAEDRYVLTPRFE